MAYYNTDSQGYITGNNSNWWQNTFNPSAQVNSQFEMSYNQANRQLNLAEEAMRSGILMEADQLRQLGINPAAYGNNLSGATFSGGSTAHPNASSSNPLGPLMSAFTGLAGVASTVAGIKKQRDDVEQRDRELDIAEKNSKTEAKNADSRAKEADANVAVADATKTNIDAQTSESETRASYNESQKAFTDAQTEAQKIENEVKRGNNATLKKLGLSENEWQSLDGIEFSSEASATLLTKMGFDAGILPGLGASGELSGTRSSKTTVKASTLFMLVKSVYPDYTTSEVLQFMLDSASELGLPDVKPKRPDRTPVSAGGFRGSSSSGNSVARYGNVDTYEPSGIAGLIYQLNKKSK